MTGTACQSVNGGRSVDECDAVTVRCLRQVRTTLERRYSTVYQAEAATGSETAMSRRIRGPMDLVSGFDYTEWRSIEPPKPSLNYRAPLQSATPLVPECWKQPLRSAQAPFGDVCCMPLTDHELSAAFSAHCPAVVFRYPLSARPQQL
jgi:hypothetical protein